MVLERSTGCARYSAATEKAFCVNVSFVKVAIYAGNNCFL